MGAAHRRMISPLEGSACISDLGYFQPSGIMNHPCRIAHLHFPDYNLLLFASHSLSFPICRGRCLSRLQAFHFLTLSWIFPAGSAHSDQPILSHSAVSENQTPFSRPGVIARTWRHSGLKKTAYPLSRFADWFAND
jgi:hypothetical protein